MEIQMRPRAESWIGDMWCHYGVGGGFGGGERIGGCWAERGGGVVLGRAVVDREVIADAVL